MIIYCNIPKSFDIEIFDHYDVTYDELIYSNEGIFKKYKKHFYEIDICDKVKEYALNDISYFVQENDHVLNKNKIITTIPYKHYQVNRKTLLHTIDHDLSIVKEIDNDVYVTYYFITNNSDYSIFEKISSFLMKNV
tara:strand:- start:1250 stop:1657 length:408 start_codon:yes stop_codon:yes gene_type:complete